MMRGGAGFDSNEARRKLLEERQYIAALELAARRHTLRCQPSTVAV
jgi:hypothetical protein